MALNPIRKDNLGNTPIMKKSNEAGGELPPSQRAGPVQVQCVLDLYQTRRHAGPA